MKKHIQFLSTVRGYRWPGSEYLWSDAAETLLASNHRVSAFLHRDLSSAEKLQALQGKGLVAQFYDLATHPLLRRWQNWRGVYRQLLQPEPDLLVISCGSLFDIAFAPGLGALLEGTTVPYVIICQFNAETFWFDDGMRQQMRRVYQKAAGCVFISDDNIAMAERQLAMRFPNLIKVTNPIWFYEGQEARWPQRGEEDPWQMAIVARLDTRWKGQDVVFEVLSQPEWQSRPWQLNLYGEGPEEGYLKQLVEFYGLADRVKFCGTTSDIGSIWAQNHIQLLATKGEGGPMVITEGMAFGRTAVTTRCGHIPEFIEDGVNGYMADFATPYSFAKAMERAWQDRENWQAMGIAARRAVAAINSQGSKLGQYLENV